MAARPRARPSSLAPLLLCLVLLPGARAQVGDGVDVGTEDAGADADGERASVEIASYFTEFTREGPYPYQVCEDLPGEIAVSGATSDVARTARCIPVEQGELEFCSLSCELRPHFLADVLSWGTRPLGGRARGW